MCARIVGDVLPAEKLLINGIDDSSLNALTEGGCFILIPPHFTPENIEQVVSLVNQIKPKKINFYSTTNQFE